LSDRCGWIERVDALLQRRHILVEWLQWSDSCKLIVHQQRLFGAQQQVGGTGGGDVRQHGCLPHHHHSDERQQQ